MKIIIVFLLMITLSVTLFARVENSDKPLKGQWDFKMKKIWGVEKAGNIDIGEVQAICTAGDGRVYIADAGHSKTHIFNKEGNYLSSFAPKGEAPGEIRHYGGGEQLFVVNNKFIFAERYKIHYFDLDGKFDQFVRIPGDLQVKLFVSEDTLLSASSSPSPLNPDKKGQIILYNLKTQSKKIILEFQPFKKSLASDGTINVVRIIIPDITPLMFVSYRDGKIYYGMSDIYQINMVNLEGKEMGSFTINGRQQKEVTAEYKKDLGIGLGDIPQELVQKIIKGLPDKASFFQGLWIAKNGLIFVFVSDPVNSNLRTFDIFSPEGKYLYSSELKFEKGLILETVYFDDEGYVYIVISDEEGTTTLLKYQITLPAL